MKKYIGLGVLCLAVVVVYLLGRAPGDLGGGSADSLLPTTFSTTTVIAIGQNTLVLNELPSRSYALFVNDSSNAIYLNFTTASTTARSYTVRLNSSGGSYEMLGGERNIYTGVIYASSSATSNLTVTEAF